MILAARERYGDSLAAIMRDRPARTRLVKRFVPTLKEQPLWRHIAAQHIKFTAQAQLAEQ